MLKRTWMVIIGLLALGLALSACDGDTKLAPELTPIPTLPPGEEPALVDALQQAPTNDEMVEAAEQNGDPLEVGAMLFAQTCAACHMDADTIGPALPRMAAEAATTAETLGMTAEEYLHQSIVDPAAYVVEGFQPIMPPGYGDQYSEDELEALIAYIMAQGGEEAADEAAMDEAATDEAGADADAPADEEPATDEAATDEADADAMNADEGEAGAAEAEGAMGGDDLVAQGQALFAKTCMACHMDADTIGPGLPHIAASAPEIAEAQGMTTEEYLHQSIVDPAAYVVEGFQPIMPPGYGDQYTEDEIQALIAYIMAQGEAEAAEAMDATDEAATEEATAEETAMDEAEAGTAVDEELAAQGKLLFAQTCMACHMDTDTIGPGLPHIAESAPEIAEAQGMTTEEYLHQSIVDPAAYVVEGFQPIMPPGYGDQYTEDEIQALIAYIMAQGEATGD